MSWLFTSADQHIGASATATVLPMNIQGWFSLGLTGLISLLSKGLSRIFSSTTTQTWATSNWTSMINDWIYSNQYKEVQSSKSWVNPIQAPVNNTLEKSRLTGTQMWTKDKRGQTDEQMSLWGGGAKSFKALFLSSTSEFFLSLGTCLPRTWFAGGVWLFLFLRGYCCPYKKRESLGKG